MKPSMLAFAAAVAATAFVSSVSSATICSAVKPYAYTTAAKQYPELKNALEVMKINAIATWYIDTYNADIKGLLAACTNAIPSIVIYGLPNKDCGPGGFSQGGGNKNTADYSAWIQKLVDVVGDREVIYILEPDAIGFASRDTGCGATYNYAANLKVAVGLLSANKNAHLYVDLSPWATQASAVKILKDLMAAGNLAGLALNTDQYLSNDKFTKLCQTYSTALGGNLHCVFDTSRNYNGSPQSEWCNARSGGVGLPPTDQTGNPLVDYYFSDAMVDPGAGQFFADHFKVLWNQGYYVKELNYPLIGSNDTWPSPSTPSSSAPTPSTSSAKPTTAAPAPPTVNPTTAPPTFPTVQPSPSTAQPTVKPSPSTAAPTTQAVVTSPPDTSAPSIGGVVQPWAQCGGINYTGATGCTQGYACTFYNKWYSQCKPAKRA
ncbi:hypothetical protein LEN26_017314 [Aphanomyces euteiches]|nr:hypothetical protein LEN26_017314 [Aphanomyces euteiches]